MHILKLRINGKLILSLLIWMVLAATVKAQDLPQVKLDAQWKNKIHNLAPDRPHFPSSGKKKILVFSLFTGFEHWVIPHTAEMIRIISDKSGAFETVESRDISQFTAENLKQYDAVVMNNTCSKPDHRNLFWDQLKAESQGDSIAIMEQAMRLEENLQEYVQQGGGLMVLHGGITTLNKSRAFSRLVGASFDYHPPQQPIHVQLEDAQHPLVQMLPKSGFTHVDEPYFYNGSYPEKDFTPLLYFNNAEIKKQREPAKTGKTYVAWIREEGKGKVMYCSPSHNAQSFENPQLLAFFLSGLQYVVGDVE
jgi:uncharacterized protein